MAFDIASVLGSSPAGKAGKMRIEYIELHLIDANPKNLYSMEGINELAANIQTVGLLEPLLVKAQPVGGHYVLISGHRRRAALRKLAESGGLKNGMHEPVPCILLDAPADVPGVEEDDDKLVTVQGLMHDLQLLFANADTRVLSSADTAMQVRETRRVLSELHGLGMTFQGRMRDRVAEITKLSPTRIARLDVIDKGLQDPRLRKAWESGKLQETTAYEIARFPVEVQELLNDPEVEWVCKQPTSVALSLMRQAEKSSKEFAATKKAAEDFARNSGAEDLPGKPGFDDRMAQMDEEDEILRRLCREHLHSILRSIMSFKEDYDFSENWRQPNIDRMRRHDPHGSYSCGWSGVHSGSYIDWDSKRIRVVHGRKHFERTWTEFFDILCGAALQQAWKSADGAAPVSAADTVAEMKWQTGTPAERGMYECRVGAGQEDSPQVGTWQRLQWLGDSWGFPGTCAPLPKGIRVFRWVKLPEV